MTDFEREQFRYQCGIIRANVSAMDVGRALGLDINSKGRCRCPFHNGQDRNMRVYPDDRGFYCFVCHQWGDCIALAKQLLSSPNYVEAAKWVDDTFRLGVFEEERPSGWMRGRRLMQAGKGVRRQNENMGHAIPQRTAADGGGTPETAYDRAGAAEQRRAAKDGSGPG